MKTDRFNEAIRRKLEGIEPPFEEKDWSAFQAFSKQQMPVSWWAKTGAKWVGYGASGLVASVLIITNIIQYQQNKELKQTVAQLQQEVKQQAAQTRVPESYTLQTPSNESTLPHPSVEKLTPSGSSVENYPAEEALVIDKLEKTEAVTSTEKRSASVQKSQRPIIEAEKNESVAIAEDRLSVIRKGTISTEVKSNVTEERVIKESDTEPRYTNQELIQERKSVRAGSNQFSNERFASPKDKRSHSGNSKKRAVGETSSEELNASLVEAQNRSAVEVLSAVTTKTLAPKLSFEAFPGGVPVFAKIPVKRKFYNWAAGSSSSTVTSEKVAKAPKIRLPKENSINVRAGVGLDLEKNYVGKSLVAGVNFGKHWGLSLGLSKGVIQGQQYKDERVFMERNRFDFKRRYVPHIPPIPIFVVKNISTEAEVVRMPVAVNYRVPLQKSWTFYASAGTTFDLKVEEKFKFDLEKWNNNPIRDQVIAKPWQASVFNNVNAGVGIEKQWNHLVVQAETYLAPNLKECSFRQEKAPAGLRIRALYQF
ncbi:hypothetical protein [Siphonobacter sp. SORGH_AS_0500]|uniref:hypothetical protein n=1 Tax=Siphonobacter sp. SORGH_AS_0500 TaxID=1864824 RepID=UPI002857B377|nr:hypothetical protein [Siphonobacter sp. SORGH_AS_0500]MDR6193112.1 hypothetical protein [Siphonobacter sp. SORGH_AS_0500]